MPSAFVFLGSTKFKEITSHNLISLQIGNPLLFYFATGRTDKAMFEK